MLGITQRRTERKTEKITPVLYKSPVHLHVQHCAGEKGCNRTEKASKKRWDSTCRIALVWGTRWGAPRMELHHGLPPTGTELVATARPLTQQLCIRGRFKPPQVLPLGFGLLFLPHPPRAMGELMGSTHGTMGAACPPCWAGSVGAGKEESERLGKRARDGCQKKENKNKGGRSSFTFCSCHSSVLANLVGGGKGKKTANPACLWREDYCTGKKESKRVWS